MARLQITGIGPVRPVEAMTSLPEAGLQAAAAAASVLFHGASVTPLGSGTWAAPYLPVDPGADDLLLATYGDSVVLLGPEPDLAPAKGHVGMGVWAFVRHSVTSTNLVHVEAPQLFRFVGVTPGEVAPEEGEPLEFERAFLAGGDDRYPGDQPAFDPDDWGAAAMVWLFGYDPSGVLPGPFDAASQPLHTVRLDPGTH